MFKIILPRPADILVELCPVPKTSYTLSSLFGKPASPEVFLMVCILDLLPVRILCGYACNLIVTQTLLYKTKHCNSEEKKNETVILYFTKTFPTNII